MVIDSTGENIGTISREEALEKARVNGLDLVIIAKNQEIPVAKIVDWSKFKYLQKKKQKNQTKSVEIKEWWFKPKIEDHDILNKLRFVKKYLKKGGKVKITVKFIRRAQYDDMRDTLNRVIELSSDFSEPASEINREGRNLSIFLKYKKSTVKENEEKQSENT
ncbi:translation initiation factor IF-3 [Candidatus Dojkabacteria bacterium]|uniref:Translation initiation factor IF-3 n=1 Tax=Candidatus Dojkabacteria bacterium TaxID=2099670 RepID=A0A955LAD9_9BACT|nr:translation initiation factor IF-3 [Candidatus Dojkabacteria bacterium]